MYGISNTIDLYASTGTLNIYGNVNQFISTPNDLYIQCGGALTLEGGPVYIGSSSTNENLTVNGSVTCGSISSGNINCGGDSVTCGAITSSGAFSCGTNAVTSGAITSSGAFSCGTNAVTCGAITSSGNFSCGSDSVTCGSVSCSGNLTCGSLNSGIASFGSDSVTCGNIICSNIQTGQVKTNSSGYVMVSFNPHFTSTPCIYCQFVTSNNDDTEYGYVTVYDQSSNGFKVVVFYGGTSGTGYNTASVSWLAIGST